jgi:hypothetical protein
MTLFELTVIYLAAGAPFGVHHFFKMRGRSMTNRIAGALLHFVLWVPFSVIYLVSLLKKETKDDSSARKLLELQTELEAACKDRVPVFEARRILERYVGLRSLSMPQSIEAAKDITIFDLADHPNVALAEICINRRNRERISLHQTNAAQDIVSLKNRLVHDNDTGENIIPIFSRIAELLNDSDIILELERPKRVKDLESGNTQWKEIPTSEQNSQASTDLRIR